MKSLSLAAAVVAALVALAVIPAAAAPNIYGTSGLIEVPDDFVNPVGSVSVAYHTIQNVGSSDENFNFYTVGFGIMPKLSISGGVKANGTSRAVLNGKYRISPESVDRPSITVGVIDATGKVRKDTSSDDNPGLYAVFGKNLTAVAEEVRGGESKPLRGYLGFGTGVLKGVFLGLDWTLTPKVSAMVEYLSNGLKDDSHFNGGVRFAATNEIRIDVGAFDFKELTAGVSFNVVKF